MSESFRTPEDYELLLYTLTEQFPAVRRSTVTFIRRGTSLARVAGELHWLNSAMGLRRPNQESQHSEP